MVLELRRTLSLLRGCQVSLNCLKGPASISGKWEQRVIAEEMGMWLEWLGKLWRLLQPPPSLRISHLLAGLGVPLYPHSRASTSAITGWRGVRRGWGGRGRGACYLVVSHWPLVHSFCISPPRVFLGTLEGNMSVSSLFHSSARHNLCLPVLTAGRPLSK